MLWIKETDKMVELFKIIENKLNLFVVCLFLLQLFELNQDPAYVLF